MLKTNLGVVILCATMIVPTASILRAEEPQEAPTGPIPSQILTAQKVFISNGGGDPNTAAGIYNELYAQMKVWGHYQLVGSPGEADLVLEIGPSRLIIEDPTVTLKLRDPKSGILLWTIDEAFRKPNDKGFNDAVDRLVNDLKVLTAPAAK